MHPAFCHELGIPGGEEMGFDEKPGNTVPPDLPFFTETGREILLKDLLKGPVILTIIYYRCENACDLLLTDLSATLRSFADKPETAPQLITVSFNPEETPADAVKAKALAFETIEKPYPADKWRFLTGRAESIKKLTDAVGFRYIVQDGEFTHPLGLIVLSPKGKIMRYIMGTDFLPLDITMSLMEASTGTIQPTLVRVLRFCFAYDPQSHRYVFNLLQVSAVAISITIGIFVLYLVLSGRKRRQKGVH